MNENRDQHPTVEYMDKIYDQMRSAAHETALTSMEAQKLLDIAGEFFQLTSAIAYRIHYGKTMER